MKRLPLSRYVLPAAGITIAGILWFGTSAIGAGPKPFEDFSMWANGEADSNANRTLDILDGGASANGWSVKRGYTIENTAEGRALVIGAGRGSPLTWNQMGKDHGIDVSKEKAVELTMKVANPRENGASWFAVWLCDEIRNGYGMDYGGIFPMKNRVGVRIFKFRENTIPFDSSKLPQFAAAEGEPAEEKATNLKEIVPLGQYVVFHLRIEQAKSGEPVTLTVWNTGCPEVSDTSYEEPLLRMEDDGKGTVFHSSDGGFGPVLDLSSLTHVGVSGAQFVNKNLTPEEQAAEPGLRFKEVDVRAVRP